MSYPILNLKTLLSMPEPPMLIDSLIPRQGITGISADPNIGKTFLAIEMARAVITGSKFLEAFEAEAGAVLFIGQDASIMDYARQVRKVVGKQYADMATELEVSGSDDVNPFDDRLKFLIRPGLELQNKKHVDKLIRTVQGIQHSFRGGGFTEYEINSTGDVVPVEYEPYDYGVSLIIIDTLASSHRSNENDNSEMQVVFDNIRRLSEETKAAVILTHHHPKSGEFNTNNSKWRGATAQLGSLDNHMELSRVEGSKDMVEFAIKKFRGLRIDDFTYRMIVDENTARLVKSDRPERETQHDNDSTLLYEHMKTTDGSIGSSDVLEFFKVALADKKLKAATISSRMYRAIKQLQKEGLIERADRGTWRITKEEENV